jgi:hypothetical protein
MKLHRRLRLAALVVATFVAANVLPASALAQCAMCKQSAYDQADQERSDRLGRAFNRSVYSMLGVPIVLVGGLAWVISRNARAMARRDGDDAAS